ncbi:BZ3500_MvSof-1268-A1-R1_Chr3-3g06608 [Microbotryum saponariae]|uniref:BZ3500_MvSof-1268-A1-R1_Chr3-3g06608 protein n=1 Tax=Microbotryum saponariae TaxID=289078 RepID=A0A2X0N0Q3_9BASI|nr:BZ3500_MvSof-1268-A1-R1_Chr3-3g06608 [Microbotryum saponariae]SDA04575.1 BZ3501_MvSof-1269-A2-R1_Chr3-2g06295 [Microbotryum saponariae]
MSGGAATMPADDDDDDDSTAVVPPPPSSTSNENEAASSLSLDSQLASLRAEFSQRQLVAEATIHDLDNALRLARSEVDGCKVEVHEGRKREEQLQQEVGQLRKAMEEGRKREGEDEGRQEGRRKQVEQAETVRRELLQAVEREAAEKNELAESLASLRALHTSLQASHSELEAALLEQTTSARSALLKTQSLQSTVTSLESDKAFLSEELDRVRVEYATTRRTTHVQITRLNDQLATLQEDEAALRNAHTTLQASHATLQERYTQLTAELSQVKQEREANEGSFVLEMAGMKRLVEMMDRREAERKKRIEHVEASLLEERARLAEEEAARVEELERERERCDELEAKLVEMRAALERGIVTSAGGAGDDSLGSPGRFALSPSAQMAVSNQKGGRSYAQIYAEYIRMEEQLVAERTENKRLQECLAQVLMDIEERAPLMKEQRIEYERISEEATQLAAQLALVSSERDQSDRRATSTRLDLEHLKRENTMLQAQLRDLGRQVRTLARQNALVTGVVSGGSADDDDEEENEIIKRAEVDLSTDAIVAAHLVTFKSINELQVQNQKLLRITREMGSQMERLDDDALGRRKWEENKAIEEAHELVLGLKEEIENQQRQIEGFARERDMFRRMLANQTNGHGAIDGGATNGAAAGGDSDRLLADVQANFDAYKNEIAIDSQRLRDDLKDAQQAAQTTRTELAKSRAQAEYTAERLRLLTENYGTQTNELAQASKRALDLQSTLARQEAVAHNLSEELIELRGQVDQLRHENTTLKTEREVTSSVQARLVEENSALSKERAHLAELMRNLQSMQNEVERSGNDARRRLENQVTRLESQASDLKTRLDTETEASRQLTLRKDFESKQYQERLDKLQGEYATTREKLVEAETSRTHLDLRVQDLQLQVTAREEKLAIYEGRSAAARAGGEASSLSATEQLEITLADVRIELEETKAKLERSVVHARELQNIADAQGGALAELQATYDAYKISVDTQIAEKDGEIASLRERLHSLTTDLTDQSRQNSELHAQIEAERVAFEKERKVLEDSLAAVRAHEQDARNASFQAQNDVRQQAQRAKDAHEKYERELVAHAEDVKQLSEVKGKLEHARRQTREAQTANEVSKTNLAASEESWARQKAALDGELADVKKRCVRSLCYFVILRRSYLITPVLDPVNRCEDLTSQNALLHQHLESTTAQAASLQKSTLTGAPGADSAAVEGLDAAVSTASPSDELFGVITFLRREKEIVDFQLDLSKQEATRLRTQLDFTTRNLEEVRQALAEERQTGPVASASTTQHAELMERIHQSELLRESNHTLREEHRAMMRTNKTLEKRNGEMRAELEPLKSRVVELQAEVEAKQHTIRLLEEDNERWKVRNQTILAKYERIDPEELSTLKTEVEQLKAELDPLKQRLQELEQEKATVQTDAEEKARLIEVYRESSNRTSERFKALQVQARTTRSEKMALETELAALKAKIESGELITAASNAAAASTASAASAETQNQLSALQVEKASLESRIQQQTETIATLEARIATHEAQQNDVSKPADDRLNALEAEKKALEDRVAHYQKREEPIFNDNKRLKGENRQYEAQLAALQTRIDELVKVKETFEANNQEAITKAVEARVAAAGTQPGDPAAVEELVRTRVAEVEARLAAERESAIAAAVETTTAELNKTLDSLRTELVAAREGATAAAPAAGTTVTASDDADAKKRFEEQLAKVQSDFEASKTAMQAEFEQLKTKLAEDAKTREQEITKRFSAELAQAQAEVKAATEAAATTSVAPAPAPEVDVDALVAAKLKDLEAGRLASQQQAIEAAVKEALAKQATENEARVATQLQETRNNMQEEFTKKGTLMTALKKAVETKLKASDVKLKAAHELLQANGIPLPDATATPATATPALSSPAPAPTPAAAPSTSTLTLKATSPARGGAAAGRGAIRGGRGRGRGAAAAGASPSRPGAAATSETPANFSIRGITGTGTAAAPATPPSSTPGGVLGRLMGGALGGKRGRDDDASADGKRQKQGEGGSG